jgi:tetratricopeptide (TPR) repeat protein
MRLSIPRRDLSVDFLCVSLRLLALLIVVSLAAAEPVGADAPKEHFPTYNALVERYRSGARESAVRELGTWGPVWIRWGVDELLHRCERANWADVRPWVRTAQGAFLLHVDTAMQGHEVGFLRYGNEEHLDAALQLLRWFRTRREQPEEARGLRPRDFYLTLASAALLAGRPDEAARLAEESLRSYDRDIKMQLLAGCAADMSPLLVRQSRGGRWSDRDLRRAEERFRRVLGVDPENGEARLRLGWVLVRRGRPDAARPLLEAVVRGPGDEDQRFLGLLFLGAAHEGLKEAEAAVEAYRKATELAPDGQAAHVALARALERVAGEEAARAVVQRFFAERGRSWVRADPWNDYPFGPPELRMRPLEFLIQRLCPR